MESHVKFANYNKGKPCYGEVSIEIQTSSDMLEHSIIESYSGDGFVGQGYAEVITEKGYEDWKRAIKEGIIYGLSKSSNPTKYKVIIKKGIGLTTDTNLAILGYVASRAVLNKIENSETEEVSNKLLALVLSSWEYGRNPKINFDRLVLE